VDAVAYLRAKNVIHEPVLRDSAEAVKCLGGHDGVEVMAVAGDRGLGARDSGFDPLLELFGGR
jgi:hypothetical protein